MQLGKVVGQVVSARTEGNLDGARILVVSYLDADLNSRNKYAACVDTVKAGSGDIVIICSSSSARKTMETQNIATDNTIVGIVDSISGLLKPRANKSGKKGEEV